MCGTSFDISINHLRHISVCRDTVQSTGLIPRYLPFSNLNYAILHFRHALSLDECRVKFIPSFCTSGKLKHREDHDFSKNDKVAHVNGHYERGFNVSTGPETDVKEVFFAGVHCGTFWFFRAQRTRYLQISALSDVGGGSVINGTRHSLARIPLRWMIRECFDLNVGIIFDAHMLQNKVGLDISSIPKAPEALPFTTLHLTKPDCTELQGFSFSHIPATIISALRSPFRLVWRILQDLRNPPQPGIPLGPSRKNFTFDGEAEEELADALSPVYDQLEKHTYWKIMEWIPCKLSLSPKLSASVQ